MLEQLTYSGVFEAVQIRKLGYPFRMTHAHFYHRFLSLLDDQAKAGLSCDKVHASASTPTCALALALTVTLTFTLILTLILNLMLTPALTPPRGRCVPTARSSFKSCRARRVWVRRPRPASWLTLRRASASATR